MATQTGTLELPDGGHLHFECTGEGSPLMLVAGLGGVGSFWEPLIPALASQHRVVIHDHRGTGRSSIARIQYSVEQMASDVLALMDALAIDRASLIGHSTGGAVGQVLALDHPQRIERLVLSSTWPRPDAYFQRLFSVRQDILRRGGPALYLNSVPLFMSPPAYLRDHLPAPVDDATAARQMPDPEVVLRRIDAIRRFDRSAELHNISQPVLVSCARDDLVTPHYNSELLVELIPQARAAFVDSGGHFYPVTRPELFAATVVPYSNSRD